MKLVDLVNIIRNDTEMVLLEIKENNFMNLIQMRGFTGNEKLIRYTKGANHTITVWDNENKANSWDFGENGYTLVSKDMNDMRDIIVKCIEEDLDIYCGGNKEEVIKSINNFGKKKEHKIEVMYFDQSRDFCVHKNETYYKHFNSIQDVLKHFIDLGYKIKFVGQSRSKETNCFIDEYIIKKN